MAKIGKIIIKGGEGGTLMTINCDQCTEVKIFQGDFTVAEMLGMVEDRGWKVTGGHTVCDVCREKKRAAEWGTH